MQRQEHTKCSNSSLPNSTKATKSYGGIKEEEQWRKSQRNPRSRSNRFPSQRGESDWWKCRSRSPLSFPSKRFKNHGRNEGGRASSQSQQWRREKPKTCVSQGGGRGIYRWVEIWPLEESRLGVLAISSEG